MTTQIFRSFVVEQTGHGVKLLKVRFQLSLLWHFNV